MSARTCDEPAFRVSPETCDAAFSSSKLRRRALRNRTPLCLRNRFMSRCGTRHRFMSRDAFEQQQRRSVVVRVVAWVVEVTDPGCLCVPTEKFC